MKLNKLSSFWGESGTGRISFVPVICPRLVGPSIEPSTQSSREPQLLGVMAAFTSTWYVLKGKSAVRAQTRRSLATTLVLEP